MELTLILTEDCNLRCRYCYQKNFIRNEMPFEVATQALESAIRAGETEIALTFFGGEPLLRSEMLLRILAHARRLEREHGIRIGAKTPTNGLLLTQEFIDRAAELSLFISLSFDGVRAAQDGGRVTPEGASSFDRALAALRLLASSRRPFGVYSVITPWNVGAYAESREFLWREGARIFVSAIDYMSDWSPSDIETLRSQYKQVALFYRRLLSQRQHFHLEPFDSRISQRTRPKDWTRCCPAVTQVTVGPDGTLYGCVEYFYRRMHPLGHVDTWLNPAAVKAVAQERAGLQPECRDCGVRDRCNHNCACVNLRTTGKANVPPVSLCLTEQETLFVIDAIALQLYQEKVPEFLLRQYSASFHMLRSIESWIEELEVERV
jgi:uncharacterized protein